MSEINTTKQQQLHSDFILELTKACLENQKILSLCMQEFKYTFLNNAAQKKVYKFLFDTFTVTNTIPSIGVIGQNFSTEQEVLNFLAKVKTTPRTTNEDLLTSQLAEHIKKVRTAHLLEDVVQLFNTDRKAEAYELMSRESEAINSFSFKQQMYTTIFKDFDARNTERVHAALNETNTTLERCPFGIAELDSHTRGGVKKGSSAMFMARSGGGKSTALRWMGLHNARLGHRVVHFQGEGTEQDCLDLYDSAWTGIMTEDMSLGIIDPKQQTKINKARYDIMARGGEIYVQASETFDSMSIEDAREILLKIVETFGPIDLVLFDYMELFTVNGRFSGEAGERRRREQLANKMTNIAAEFKCAVVTATQANDISPKDYNNPDFVLTRHHISEFKGAVKPFSYFLTINATDEESNNNIARLYEDKFRFHKSGRVVPIVQSLHNGRFYNTIETEKQFIIGAA